MSHSRGFPRRSSPRRRTEWSEGVGGNAVTMISIGGNTLLGSFLVTTFGEETLVRVRGLLHCVLTAATAVGDGYFGAVGIGLATTAAVAAGAASVPTPITELGWDGWLYH